MAVVNIVVTAEQVLIRPEKVVINRVDQTIVWNLRGGTWQDDGIVFDMNPPPPALPWPGPQARREGETYVVDAGDPLPHGSPVQEYRYTIKIFDDHGRPHIITRGGGTARGIAAEDTTPTLDGGEGEPLSIDPGIENQPEP